MRSWQSGIGQSITWTSDSSEPPVDDARVIAVNWVERRRLMK
ncbi:MAG: hypothetical protein ABSG03_27665 [Bryobacteraceae bacterium]